MKAPGVFDWYAQVAQSADKIDDPSIAWPETRGRAPLGTITITGLAASPGIDRRRSFCPALRMRVLTPQIRC